MQKKEVTYDVLDEYNPFDGKDKSQHPAVINISYNTEINDTSTSQLLSNISEKNCFKEDRDARKQKESTKLINDPANNWPPFPKFCPVTPCFYLDISSDIPEQYRGLVKFAYYLWMAYTVVMVFNVLGSLAYYITENSMISATTFGTSIILVIIFPLLSFLLWFRPLYKAVKWDHSTNYFLFFIIMCAQIVITTIQMLGINWLGSCGFINALMMFRKDILTGCIMLFIAVEYCVILSFFIFLLCKVNYIYRHSTLADIKTARSEISTNLLNGTSSFQRK